MPGVLRLPSGRLVRGRGLRYGEPEPEAVPDFGLVLVGKHLARWPGRRDGCGGPTSGCRATAPMPRPPSVRRGGAAPRSASRWPAAGGKGRTGTALACLAVLDGVAPGDAVAYVRAGYSPRAVETPWQRRYVQRFRPE